MESTLMLKSKRTGEQYPAELYEKNGCLIIRHSSLDRIFYGLPDDIRPKMTVEPFNMAMLPCTPPMFAVKCALTGDGVHIEQLGELLCSEWELSNPIARANPLATCQNRAFDKAFIRYMSFDISGFEVHALYSSAEIPVDGMIPLSDKNIGTVTEGQENAMIGSPAAPSAPAASSTPVAPAAPVPGGHMPSPPMEPEKNPSPEPWSMNGGNTVSGQPGNAPVKQAYDSSYRIKEEPYAEDPYAEEALDMGMFATPDGFLGVPNDVPINSVPPFAGQTPIVGQAPAFPDVNTEDNTAPFPWMQSPDNKTGIPDELPVDMPGVAMPARPMEITVRRISYEAVFKKAKIETDCGIFFYSAENGAWESPSADMRSIDLNDLYAKASKHLGCDLGKYHGFLAP